MSIRFDIWGFLPVIYGKSDTKWGHSRLIYIQLPNNYSKIIEAHERFHVKQFYTIFAIPIVLCVLLLASVAGLLFISFINYIFLASLIMAAIIWVLPWTRERLEIAAYGESIRTAIKYDSSLEVTPLLNHYAKTFNTASAYDYENDTLASIKVRMNTRFIDGRLF